MTRDGITSVNPRTESIKIGFDSSARSFTGMVIHSTSSVPPGKMYIDVTSNRLFVGADTASQIRFHLDPAGPEKQEKHMSSKNSKTFEITFADGSTELVEAQEVSESNGRLRLTGFVEGVDDHYGQTLVKSFNLDKVDEYRTVPKPETDAKVVGKNTYRVNLVAGGAKDVKADHVLFQAGTGDKPGRYSLVTNVKGADSRTEYIVAEDKVDSVERVEADGALTNLTSDAADKNV